jgi:hypothetical protein
MRTIKIEVSLGIGLGNATHRDILDVEVEEDATEAQIDAQCDAEAVDWANNYIDIGMKRLDR